MLPGFHNFKDTQHGLSFYEFDEHQRLRAQKRWERGLEQDEDWNNQMKRLYQTNATEEEIAALKDEMNALPAKL